MLRSQVSVPLKTLYLVFGMTLPPELLSPLLYLANFYLALRTPLTGNLIGVAAMAPAQWVLGWYSHYVWSAAQQPVTIRGQHYSQDVSS